MSRPLPVRLAARLAVPAALLAGAAAPAAAQISPGPLARPHAALEGSTSCLRCHAPGRGVTAQRCLDCHAALGRRIAAGEGLHADPGHRRCESCHIEHHGRDFELVFWGERGRDAFDHRAAGWPLTGAHREAGCRDCHRPAHLDDPRRLAAGGADPERTFLGLDTGCLTCHRDEHRGQLGTDRCASCHGTAAWRPATGFDHGATGFPLTGLHQRVACGGCHPTERDPQPAAAGPGAAGSDAEFLRFAGIAHARCADCHRDPHAGRLGADCASCHSTAGWGRVDAAGFDHGRTRFPLRGRHRALACTACHRGGAAAARLAFGSCADCHRDPHAGRLGAACASCHTADGWRRVDRAGFDHDATRFPLRGRHRDVACTGCHAGGAATARLAFGSCSDCHRDPHLGQLADAAGGGACADCHTVEGFVPATFTVADHRATRLPLDGAHLAVACDACHAAAEPAAGGRAGARRPALLDPGGGGVRRPAAAARFDFADLGCGGCHGDPHGGETARAAPAGCATCHVTAGWSRVGFDHAAATGWALEGGHARVACAGCHPARRGASGEGSEGRRTGGRRGQGSGGAQGAGGGQPAADEPLAGAGEEGGGAPAAGRLRFEGTPSGCAGCHGDPHRGAFDRAEPSGGAEPSGEPKSPMAGRPPSAAEPAGCLRCHTPAGWAVTGFDHRGETGFALEGAHARLECAACHRRERRGGRTELPFEPLPTTCEGCHGSASARSAGGGLRGSAGPGAPAFIAVSSTGG